VLIPYPDHLPNPKEWINDLVQSCCWDFPVVPINEQTGHDPERIDRNEVERKEVRGLAGRVRRMRETGLFELKTA
jgi:hypothetical protein